MLFVMKLTLQIRLLPTADQKADLLQTMERFNEAASFVARVGFENAAYDRVSIHHLCYHEIRKRFELPSQMATRVIAKVVECFGQGRSRCPVFKSRGAICYDNRLMSFKGQLTISLRTLAGRILISSVCNDRQKELRGRIKGQADLVYRDGKFYLHCTMDAQEGLLIKPIMVLGIDLGILNIATDSEGEIFSGDNVEAVRRRYTKRRAGLNRCGTKSAKRRLSKIRKKEANFRRNANHVISKQLVAKAKATGSAIALEDLKGIRDRVSVRKPQRNRLGSWAFSQLRSFVTYKAALAGVPVVLVNPRNTSRTCSECGHCEKANRKSQGEFHCRHCEFSENADFNAALNIRALALAKVPIAGTADAVIGLRDCG